MFLFKPHWSKTIQKLGPKVLIDTWWGKYLLRNCPLRADHSGSLMVSRLWPPHCVPIIGQRSPRVNIRAGFTNPSLETWNFHCKTFIWTTFKREIKILNFNLSTLKYILWGDNGLNCGMEMDSDALGMCVPVTLVPWQEEHSQDLWGPALGLRDITPH